MDERRILGDVMVDRTPAGVRFVFPRRMLMRRTRDRVHNAIGLAFFIVLALAPCGLLFDWPADDRAGLLCFLSLWSLFFVALVSLGIWWGFGHSEIAIEGSDLVASEGAGPFRWVRRWPLQRLLRLEITTRSFWPGTSHEGQHSRVRNQRELLWALRGYFAGCDPVVLALGYPLALLEAAAQALTDLVESMHSALAPRLEGSSSRPLIEIVPEQDREPPRPELRDVRVSDDGGTLRFEFASADGGACVFLVGTILAALCGIPVVLTLVEGGSVLLLACPGVFAWAGVLMIVSAFLERRRPGGALLELSTATLQVTEPGVMKTYQRQWPHDELTAIRCIRDSEGPSVLQLDLADGQRVRLLRCFRGLDWVAWRLRQALQLPEVPP